MAISSVHQSTSFDGVVSSHDPDACVESPYCVAQSLTNATAGSCS